MKKDAKYTPACPFCERHLDRPQETRTEFGNVLAGRCPCGAVVVCDPTGHNIGEAYMEALALMKGDYDLGALSEEDYRLVEMDYDLRSHSRIYGKGLAQTAGKLLCIRAASTTGAPRVLEVAVQDAETVGRKSKQAGGGMISKKRVKELLAAGSFEEVRSLFLSDKGMVRALISLTYDKSDTLTWRAIEALGVLARDVPQSLLPVIRETVRKMIWSMTDEAGAIGWSAPEILGEIIRNNPEEFLDIVPILWTYRDEELFMVNTLWAIGRIAELRPELVAFVADELVLYLGKTNPAARGHALWILGSLGLGGHRGAVENFFGDDALFTTYRGGELVTMAVGAMAREAVDKNLK